MENFIVEFYEKADGTIPIEDFLDSLNQKSMVRVYGLIGILEEYGNLLREPYSKYLNDGIFELRVQCGNDRMRVLYFFYYGKQIVITNGFIKKTKKTPKKEIELAKKYREDYLQRVRDIDENIS